MVADVLHRDLVAHEHDESLEHVVPALGNQRALAGAEADDDEQDAGRDPHVDDVLGDVEADVAVAHPEAERDHDLVLHVVEDVVGDALLVLGHLLFAGGLGGMLGRGRRRLRLRQQHRREKQDHVVAPRECARTNSTSTIWVTAYSAKNAIT